MDFTIYFVLIIYYLLKIMDVYLSLQNDDGSPSQMSEIR